MNNHTISVFGSGNYEAIYKSFDLKYLILKKHPDDEKACFVLVDERDSTNKRVPVCVNGANSNIEENIE
jgi:hypothetical protein